MHLAIFDLDGTLTRTTRVDEMCYVRALRDALGITEIDSEWSHYTHSTDSGITTEIFQNCYRRLPTADEVERLRQRFVGLLAATFRVEPASCTEVHGAAAALRRLNAHPQWRIALATGSWQASARLKLESAGLDLDGVPAAFADDSLRREEIVALARSRALQCYEQDDFSRTVYVGDAPWDVRAARRLGIPFVGIGGERAAERLHREGADRVLRDFEAFDRVLRALEETSVPGTPL